MTPRQNEFVIEYLKDLNATKAAQRAGYKHPNVQGSQLLAQPNIKARVGLPLRGSAEPAARVHSIINGQ